MWDTLLGELGWAPATAKALSWVEVDCALAGNHLRWQKSMVGLRKIGTDVYNYMAKHPINEAQYLHLPDLDGPAQARKAAASVPDPAFLERIAKRFGHPVILIN